MNYHMGHHKHDKMKNYLKIISIGCTFCGILMGVILIYYLITKDYPKAPTLSNFNSPIMSAKLAVKKHLPAHGLKNKGNTCFFNASMQGFLSLPKIVRFFLDTPFDPSKQPICFALKNFIFEYKNSAIVDPAEFISAIRSKIKLFSGRQQDAHEFLEYFLDELYNECEPPKSENKLNPLRTMLGIFTEDSIKCHQCGFISVNKFLSKMQYLFIKDSVQRSINNHLNFEEMVDESSPWKCTQCDSKSKSGISHSIKDTSEYFIIHLNRFHDLGSKNLSPIRIDDVIEINQVSYQNVGIVCHSGTLSGGHYYAYCKRDKWMEFNDSQVQSIDSPPAAEESVYILFYSRVDE